MNRRNFIGSLLATGAASALLTGCGGSNSQGTATYEGGMMQKAHECVVRAKTAKEGQNAGNVYETYAAEHVSYSSPVNATSQKNLEIRKKVYLREGSEISGWVGFDSNETAIYYESSITGSSVLNRAKDIAGGAVDKAKEYIEKTSEDKNNPIKRRFGRTEKKPTEKGTAGMTYKTLIYYLDNVHEAVQRRMPEPVKYGNSYNSGEVRYVAFGSGQINKQCKTTDGMVYAVAGEDSTLAKVTIVNGRPVGEVDLTWRVALDKLKQQVSSNILKQDNAQKKPAGNAAGTVIGVVSDAIDAASRFFK